MRILVVSDHHETESLWVYNLGYRSLQAVAANFHSDPRIISLPADYELIILDIHDSRENALAISRYARASFDAPILLFTYERDERFHVEAYCAGIDEIIGKPIGNALAISKVLAWLRWSSVWPPHRHEPVFRPASYNVGRTHSQDCTLSAFQIDPGQRVLTTPDGRIIKLSKLECRLLSFLVDNRGQTVSPERMIEQVWVGNPSIDFSHLKNLIYRLRKKIEPAPNRPRYLHTVPGFGYTFNVEDGG